jgi:hypothetical protein
MPLQPSVHSSPALFFSRLFLLSSLIAGHHSLDSRGYVFLAARSSVQDVKFYRAEARQEESGKNGVWFLLRLNYALYACETAMHQTDSLQVTDFIAASRASREI